MGKRRGSYRVGREILLKRYHSEDLGVDQMIIYNGILNKYAGRAWIELVWLRTEQAAGCFEYDNISSGSNKFAEFLNQMRSY
jgi:hypothetical protein